MKCYYCEREMKMPDPIRKDKLFKTKDHVIPKSIGGKKDNNTVWCCLECNASKGCKTLFDWECYLSARKLGKWNIDYYNLRMTIIGNIRKHPLYNPQFDSRSFRKF